MASVTDITVLNMEFKELARTFLNFPFPRTIKEWNLLPLEVVCAHTLFKFKNDLNNDCFPLLNS